MDLDFKNKTVIITGGTRGIGKSLALVFNEAGATVIITGTKEPSAVNLDLIKNKRRLMRMEIHPCIIPILPLKTGNSGLLPKGTLLRII